MTEFAGIGRMLILLGVAFTAVGALLAFGPRVPWLGRLPGDLTFGSGNTRVYIPLATCLVVSIVLSLLLRLFARR